MNKSFLVFCGVGVAALMILAIVNNSQSAPTNDANGGPTLPIAKPATTDSANPDVVIHRSAEALLAEFRQSKQDEETRMKNESLSAYMQDDTETAEMRYRGKTIQITGTLTGVFIPSIQASEQLLQSRGTGIFDEQGGADSFVTMGGPTPRSVTDTLSLPGIQAWAKNDGSLQPLFGEPDLAALSDRLVVGSTITLLCKFSSTAGSADDLSISLENCVLPPSVKTDREDTDQNWSRPQQQSPAPIERRPPPTGNPY